jgi:hypothetical protein
MNEIWVLRNGGIIRTRKKEVLSDNPVPVLVFHHKSYIGWSGFEIGPSRWDVFDLPPEPWLGVLYCRGSMVNTEGSCIYLAPIQTYFIIQRIKHWLNYQNNHIQMFQPYLFKISVLVYGMLIRCWLIEQVNNGNCPATVRIPPTCFFDNYKSWASWNKQGMLSWIREFM